MNSLISINGKRIRQLVAAAVLLSFPLIQARAQLETRSSSPVVHEPRSLAVADFNHDGNLDIAVAAWSSGRIAILLGRGDGTFRPAVYYGLPDNSANWVVAADFNRDGNQDLAVASLPYDNVTVLLGNGDGTFQMPVQYPTTQTPTFVASADFNGDGKPDLIVANAPFVSVLLGNGDGTFQPPWDDSSYSPAGLHPLTTGDFDNDGNLDVAVIGGEDVGILLGNGDGTFRFGGEYPDGSFADSITTGDFNGDHNLDLAVANGSGFQINILLGNGDGTFQAAVPISSNEPAAIHTADLNGDGKLDLLYFAGVGSQTELMVMLGNGDGTFQRPTTFSSLIEGTDLAVADFNGDQMPDIATADFRGNVVDVLLNTGVTIFSPTTPLSFSPQLLGTTSVPQNVTLKNKSQTALAISSLHTTGPFQLASGTTCASSVAPGGSCTLSVAFQPTTIGSKAGSLALVDSASSKPQVIALNGAGTVITVSPTQLNFGSQKVGTKSMPQNVTVTNLGSTAVDVTSIKVAGNEAHDFPQTNTCGSQIAAGASCTISVTFRPSVTGTRTATLKINDSGGASPQSVALSGTGT